MSDRYDILFETDRFNLTERKPYFINDCCYGDDAAAWLRAQLQEVGITASEPGQEDWGWYIGVEYEGQDYFLGINGDPLKEGENFGLWRLIVQRHRTLLQKLTGANKMAPDDELLIILQGLLNGNGITLRGIE